MYMPCNHFHFVRGVLSSGLSVLVLGRDFIFGARGRCVAMRVLGLAASRGRGRST